MGVMPQSHLHSHSKIELLRRILMAQLLSVTFRKNREIIYTSGLYVLPRVGEYVNSKEFGIVPLQVTTVIHNLDSHTYGIQVKDILD